MKKKYEKPVIQSAPFCLEMQTPPPPDSCQNVGRQNDNSYINEGSTDPDDGCDPNCYNGDPLNNNETCMLTAHYAM